MIRNVFYVLPVNRLFNWIISVAYFRELSGLQLV